MNFNAFVNTIPLRDDVLDDLTYLQKHLRLLIKYHQKLSSKLYHPSTARHGADQQPIRSRNFEAMRSLMDELEDEMADISVEQKMLTNIVRNCLNSYRMSLKDKAKQEFDVDVANGFITRVLQNHYEKNYFQIEPNNVKNRMSEEELKKKFISVKALCDDFESVPYQATIKKEGRQSLLKPQFRKPAASWQDGGQVQKKRVGRPEAKQKPQTITNSRMNLLRALSNAKNGNSTNQLFRGEYDEHGRLIKSDEDCSDKSSSYDGADDVDPLKLPARKRRNGSNESSDSDYTKKYPNLPIEPPAKTEYSQPEFLSIFKLMTPEELELLKIRRSVRKRRSCTKNEKNDFHYGSFDLNEAAYRVRLNNNKKSIFYSTSLSRSLK